MARLKLTIGLLAPILLAGVIVAISPGDLLENAITLCVGFLVWGVLVYLVKANDEGRW